MIQNPIYKPSGRALEYSPDALALNIYRGCSHGCTYCFAPSVLRMSREEFSCITTRFNIAEAVKRQIEREQMTGKLIHLCFTCDPYPAGIDTTPTRECIKAIKESGNHVQILTKGGSRALRDFDLLDSGDWFGVTISKLRGFTDEGLLEDITEEPWAAVPHERLTSLRMAKSMKINTWISCEPVLRADDIYWLIGEADYVNLFRIGKLNHAKTPELKYIHDDINWAEFGRTCVELCEQYGRRYYIKEDLRKEMEATA